MGVLAAVLGLGVAVTLVGEILDDIKIDGVIVRLDAEYAVLKSYLLSGIGSVNL